MNCKVGFDSLNVSKFDHHILEYTSNLISFLFFLLMSQNLVKEVLQRTTCTLFSCISHINFLHFLPSYDLVWIVKPLH